MTMRITILVLGTVLAGGCSFIQGWGTYRDGPTPGMDAGLADSGPPPPTDAGPADAEACNECDEDTCAAIPGGECLFVDTESCIVCVFPGLEEGEACDDTAECDEDLVCTAGACRRPCMISPDCVASGGGVCVRLPLGETVCGRDECFVTDGTCGPMRACRGLITAEGDRLVGVCAATTPADVPGGMNCEPERDSCEDRFVCLQPQPGQPGRCFRWARDPGDCEEPDVLSPIGGSMGPLLHMGVSIGVCLGPARECFADADCTGAPGLTQCGVAGVCQVPCADDSMCTDGGSPGGERCGDLDGDRRFECIPNLCADTAGCVTGQSCLLRPGMGLGLCYSPCDPGMPLSCRVPGRCVLFRDLATELCASPCIPDLGLGRCDHYSQVCRDVDGNGTGECVARGIP